MRLGIISDTHGLLRPEAVAALRGSDLIVHAGDVGKAEILEALRGLAPVVAVRGNVDTADWARELPHTATVQAGPAKIHVLHDLKELGAVPEGVSIVVTGHTHKATQRERDGILYVNPGSAGPRRFRLPVTVACIELGLRPWPVEIVTLLP